MIRALVFILSFLVTQAALAETIELRESNTIVFREVVTSMSVAKVQVELMKKAQSGETLYLVLDTPGGSVDAGMELISFVKGLGVKVHTITLFAASMGFQIAQNLDTRYITSNGVLMSHRATLGELGGEVPGELITRLDFIVDSLTGLDSTASKRMGIKLGDYQTLIRDEYWVRGDKAVKANAADKVVNVRCSSELSGTIDQTVYTFFGPVEVTFSKCPLISGVLAVKFAEGHYLSTEHRAQLLDYIGAVYGDKERAVRKYIKTHEYKKFE